MTHYRVTSLFLFLILCIAPSCRAQSVPAEQAPTPYPVLACSGFFGWGGHTGWGGAYDISTGCLTVANGSVQFRTGTDYQTSLFDFPITDLAGLQSKKFKFWKGFQLKLKSGKKWDFYAFYIKGEGPDEAAAIVEKAIRDLAAQHAVPLK
jgi:hypothetical protein